MQPGCLSLFNGDGVGLAHFNAAFAAKAFFRINRDGLAVLHFKNFHRANIYTLFTTFTFVSIHDRIKSHFSSLLCCSFFYITIAILVYFIGLRLKNFPIAIINLSQVFLWLFHFYNPKNNDSNKHADDLTIPSLAFQIS
jgi:hypothetical protein